jgi:PD-(D/E)XK endonuclease
VTTHQKGAIAEACIAAQAIKLGIGVFRPLADERYDLIFDMRPELLRIQCKWVTLRKGVMTVFGASIGLTISTSRLHCDGVQGAVAQLGERPDGIRKVRGSIPLGSID